MFQHKFISNFIKFILLFNQNLVLFTISMYYSTIQRTKMSYSTITSMYPSSRLSNSIKNNHNIITEIIYLKNIISLNKCDNMFIDDEHFCSLLTDQGFIVHVINIKDNLPSNIILAFNEALNWRIKQTTNRMLFALLCHELSVPKILNYVSEVSISLSLRSFNNSLFIHLFILLF